MLETPYTYVYFNAVINSIIPNTESHHLSHSVIDRLCELFVRRVCSPGHQVTFYDTVRLED
jgi:hypothetical protein